MSPEIIAVIGVCIPVLGNILIELIRNRKNSSQKEPVLKEPVIGIVLPPTVSLPPRPSPKDKAKNWVITGIVALIFGIVGYLLGIWLNFSPSTSSNNTVALTLTLAPTLTPIPCAFHSKPATRKPFLPSNLTGTITSLNHCDKGLLSSRYSPIEVEGSAGEIPENAHLWLFVYAPDGKYYPQCNNIPDNNIPATKAECTVSGDWSMRTYLGYSSNECKPYYLVLVATDEAVTNFLVSTVAEWERKKSYPGLRYDELKHKEIKEVYSAQVETGQCISMQTPTP